MNKNYLTAVIAVLALLGGLTAAAAGPVITPYPLAYSTGWCDGSNWGQPSIFWQVTSTTTCTMGWAAFNDSVNMPVPPYSSMVVSFYQDSASSDKFVLRYAPDADPFNSGKVTLYGALADGNSQIIFHDSSYTGWHYDTIPNPASYPPVNGMLVISWCDNGSGTPPEHGRAEGYGQSYPPYIQFLP
jgi:hypothetical protein